MSNYPPPPPSGQGDPSVIPPGMYRASDGNVYPQQGYQQPPPPKKKGGAGKVLLIVAACTLGLCGLLGAVVAISGNSDEEVETGSAATTVAGAPATTAKADEASLYPNRPDKKKGDKERAAGQSADLSGYTVTMTSGTYKREINQFEKDGYVVADVSISNRDKAAQSYNTFEWKLLTPGGTIIDPCFCGGKQLGSGDLVTGGKIDGQLVFEVGDVKGAYYVIYDPSDLGSERAIWQITV